MSKRKVAEELRRYVNAAHDLTAEESKVVWRQFDALAAVARAAERYAWGLEDDDPLARALARLKKAGAR